MPDELQDMINRGVQAPKVAAATPQRR
jgi:hypothetical protein